MNKNIIVAAVAADGALALAAKAAETRRDWLQINQVASTLIGLCRGIEQDPELRLELRSEATLAAEGLRYIQERSCEESEQMRGKGDAA